MTRRGRLVVSCATVARMSGFSVSASVGAAPIRFLILLTCGLAGRQSATAAANPATSAGRAFITAASISRALATLMTLTRGGPGAGNGPENKGPYAPAPAGAPHEAGACLARVACSAEATR